MKQFIFIVGIAILTLGATACKTQNKVSESINNNSTTTTTTGELTEKYWKLIELFGNPVTAEDSNNKDAHLTFKAEGNQFNANAGCNTIIGTFETKGLDRITISPSVSTMMMCLNMDVETKLLEVLNMTDSYVVRNDTLSLNRARMAPLARFVAVYMQ
ncbi:MAG: META domain-containing protein [Dysgonamonadaceae bacterium]|jgi:heat shock protein HslJ|nr:META domain-containing protein [Dysgonamonadaceae bacterium]